MDFSQVEAEFRRLRGQFEAGTLTEDEFKAQLQELMIQDKQGRWWMLGYETERWYYHDGQAWVQAEPPPLAKTPPEPAPSIPEPVIEPEEEVVLEAREQPVQPDRVAVAAPEKETAGPVAPEEAVRARPSRSRAWIYAIVAIAVLAVIVIVIALSQRDGPGPEAAMWAEPPEISRGQCAMIYWEAPGHEVVFIIGPGFDSDLPLEPVGKQKVCPEEGPAGYKLVSPDGRPLLVVEVLVRP